MKSDRNLEHLLRCKSQASNIDTHTEFILGLLLVCFWEKQTKQKPSQQIPTMNDLYKTSSFIEYWAILQLQEQRVIIDLINCNNHERYIQIYFPQTIIRRIMEDCDRWPAQKN